MSFGVPLFLIAMLAGLIPVVLHAIHQHQAKTVPFGTLRFLRLGAEKSRRRKNLHDIVLLLLRVASLMLIGLALARPTLTHLRSLLGSGDATAVVLIVDNSASMGTVDVGGARWDAATEAARKIMDQLQPQDSLALLLTCGPPRPTLDRLYPNQEVILQTLAETRLSDERADIAAQIHAADAMLDRSGAVNKEIYVITDMQAVSWDAAVPTSPIPTSSALPSSSSSSLRRSDRPLILVDVHREPLPNVSLVDIALESAGPVAGMPIQARVLLQGDPLVEQQRHVELVVDDTSIETSPTITIPAASTAEHTFAFSVSEPGIHAGFVRLTSDDACRWDDQRRFAISASSAIPVTIVKADDHPIAYLDDAYYLQRALTPIGDDQSWSIQTSAFTLATLSTAPLEKFAVVFCVNLPAVDGESAKRLRDYVRGGGHLVWICGDNVDPNLYNAMHLSAASELLPVPLAELRQANAGQANAGQPDGWKVGWLDATHPALFPLTQPASLYQSVLVSNYISMEPFDEAAVRVLARLDDGQPLLVERKLGSGSVLLLGTSVHVDWSNLPLRPIFLPLVAGMTFHLADSHAMQNQLAAGRPIEALFREREMQAAEVTRPNGEIVRLGTTDDRPSLVYDDTHDVGIYKIRQLQTPNPQAFAVAVNLDAEEIPGIIASPAVLASMVGEDRLVVCDDPAAIADTIHQLRQGTSLMELFLLAVLVALIAEVFVANRRVDQEQPQELREIRSVQPTYRRLPDQLDDLAGVTKR